MANLIDITLLTKTDNVDKNGKARADRYNIYGLYQNDTDYGVVTRSGIFQEDGSPKLSLISGKFHPTLEAAQKAYKALVSKMEEKGASKGSYSFEPEAEKEWQALTNSVEKRQRALEARRAKKAEREGVEKSDEDKSDKSDEEKSDEELEQQDQVPEQVPEQVPQPEIPEQEEDEEVLENKIQEVQQEAKPKKKGGRKSKTPDEFQPGEEGREDAWQQMDQAARKKWRARQKRFEKDLKAAAAE